MQDQAPDGIRGAARVVHELRKIGVALLHHVLRECVDQIAKQLHGQLVRANRIGDSRELRFGRASRLDGVERSAIAVELRESVGIRGVSLVRDVVGAAREAVNRRDGRAHPPGQEHRCNRKVLVVIDAQGVAETLEFSRLYRLNGPAAGKSEAPFFGYNSTTAKVAELVDALDLGSSAERHVGSTPSFRTRSRHIKNWCQRPIFAAWKTGL